MSKAREMIGGNMQGLDDKMKLEVALTESFLLFASLILAQVGFGPNQGNVIRFMKVSTHQNCQQ